MKKPFTLVLIFAILFTACNFSGETAEVSQTNEGLSIYIGHIDIQMKTALAIFKEKYPDIPVEVIRPKTTGAGPKVYEEENAFLATIMAGDGPDLLSIGQFYNFNCEKSVLNGIAADMSKYYDADAELDPTLNKKIMDAGIIDGKRYFFPLSYSLPLLLSTQKTLDKFGIKPEDCPDSLSFFNETGKIIDSGGKLIATPSSHLYFLARIGTNPLDVKNGKVNTDYPLLKKGYEWLEKLKPFYTEEEFIMTFSEPIADIRKVADGETVFVGAVQTFESFIHYHNFHSACELLASVGETPVIFPFRSGDGGLTAQVKDAVFVRSTSPNKENAYKFIQVLLSNEVQSNYNLRDNNHLSVSKKAMDDYYEETKDWIFGTAEGFPDERPILPRELHDEYLAYADEIDNVVYSDMLLTNIFFSLQYRMYDGMTYEEAMAKTKERTEFAMSE